MGGETSAIAEIANKVAQDVFKWFRWERVDLLDQNFDCNKSEKHAPNKKSKHTHPVDVVFKYSDPYLSQTVFLNTDLKSYAKDSISGSGVRAALKSLAQTIDCARISAEWKDRYVLKSEEPEIRGLLFVYNHDAEYDKDFSKLLVQPKKDDKQDSSVKSAKVETIPLEAGQIIHVVEPRTIAYMTTIISDVHRLHSEGSFPTRNYYFIYPDLKLHKARGDKFNRPATIEMICGPFVVVGHEAVVKYDEETEESKTTYQEGAVIYYNRPGSSHLEFMYLFDVLSSYQILDDRKLRIRVAHNAPHRDIRSNFERAKEMYVHDWGFDKYKAELLDEIELSIIEIQKTSFSQTDIGWRRSE